MIQSEIWSYQVTETKPKLIIYKTPQVNRVKPTIICHGAHTREEQEHADEDINSNDNI